MIQKMAKTDNESGALFEVNMKFDINVRSMRHTNFLHPGDLFCTLATYPSKHGASTTDRLDDWIFRYANVISAYVTQPLLPGLNRNLFRLGMH